MECSKASANTINAANLKPGVTVTEDAASATGFSATFVFEAAHAHEVALDISACFYEDGGTEGVVPETYYSPYEWKDGMFGVGYEGYVTGMKKVNDTDYWAVTLPLPHGVFQYGFKIDQADRVVPDPANPAEKNPNPGGGEDGRSTVFIPLNSQKQPSAVDYRYLDASTVKRPGKVIYVNYPDINGDSAPLGIYLPYDYHENNQKPYKVVYISHGYDASEVNWFGCGRMNTVFDHLIEDGRTEPAVLVTMNHTKYAWDFDVMMDNLMNKILPFVEENYHVSREASGRAFAGLSMGAMTACNVLSRFPSDFQYFGIFSGAELDVDFSGLASSSPQQASVMLGAGNYDFGYINEGMPAPGNLARTFYGIAQLKEKFDAHNICYGYEIAKGGHDWFVWDELIRIFAEKYLWKSSAPGAENNL